MRFALLLMLVGLLAGCGTPTAHLNYSAAFVPPHHEPIVNGVARYKVTAEPVIVVDKLRVGAEFTGWGSQTWQNSNTVGHGFDAWGNSDWSVEEWTKSVTYKVDYAITPKFGLYSEYYVPLGEWRGHGLGTDYWWLVGIKGRIN